MDGRRRILTVSGSLRSLSTNTATLRTVGAVAPASIVVVPFDGLAGLPHFSPDDDIEPLAPPVEELRAAVHAADGVLFSTPEYAGDLPGSFKNLLDWTVGDDRTGSMDGKPVAWVNCSPRGAVGAHAALRTVLGYLGASVVAEACVDVAVNRDAIGPDGTVVSAEIRRALLGAVSALAASPAPG